MSNFRKPRLVPLLVAILCVLGGVVAISTQEIHPGARTGHYEGDKAVLLGLILIIGGLYCFWISIYYKNK